MDPEIQKQMGAMRMMRQQQQNCMAKVQAMKQTQKRIELTQKEISTVSLSYSSLYKFISRYNSVGRIFPRMHSNYIFSSTFGVNWLVSLTRRDRRLMKSSKSLNLLR